jgi:integrase
MRGRIIKREGSNNYTIVLQLGLDPATGKRKQQWIAVKGNKREAENKLTELLHDLGQGTLVKPNKITVSQWLLQWIKDYAWPNLAPRTAEGYENMIRKHIIPGLGKHKLTDLKPEHLQLYYSDRLKSGLSARTVRHHHVTLHTALKTALKRGIIVRNPADAVDPPHFIRPEMQTIGEADLTRFLDAAKETEYYPLFYLALFTGMRRSELLALRWSDVDLILCKAYVTRSLHHMGNGKTVFRPTKTAKSQRSVALSPSTVQVLSDYKATRETTLLHSGKLLVEDDLIFPGLPDTVTHAWLKLSRKLGLKGIHLHSARHSHASLLLRQGVHPKIVQERLGHSSIQVTLDTYSHVAPGLQEAAANGFDDFVRNRVSVKETTH